MSLYWNRKKSDTEKTRPMDIFLVSDFIVYYRRNMIANLMNDYRTLSIRVSCLNINKNWNLNRALYLLNIKNT
ncbi:dubious [Schizosaccharomyces pombe]|uniref:Uncharacterized protein C18.20 n=1 Tax=Schizosaccharomyces pombe (strain 972 / ATCC 24843) TaxID=284812 RepID=YQ9K_SCHPO|nr:uncharacterized protein SPCC18.20 [Schizosaccharomyces pombe]G2TRU1.1 RecName: Full=Uncharacterized protein C18.20 [Schizosaccharomyces pombe 972h-]CCD31400.1 sequence orphan [Schizosaccharomyces pombe]|eukprot:NP_001343190.1 uncharacterized protein SPCC18.20 [Schizosaccharomyces pombe]